MYSVFLFALVAAATAAYVPSYFKLALPSTQKVQLLVDSDGRVQPAPVYHPYELQVNPAPLSQFADSTETTAGSTTGSVDPLSPTSSSISPSSAASATHTGAAPQLTALVPLAPMAAALLML